MKLQDAYDTISDPEKRHMYDRRWPDIRDKVRTQRELDKRQNEAAETENRRAEMQRKETARQERLRSLNLSRSRYDSDVFELRRVVRKLTADLKRLQDRDDEETRKEKERNSW